MYSEIFPSRLKGMRKSHGFTQEEVASELKINRQNISHYERGEREPDIETLAQFADFYGVSTDFLIGNGMHEFHGFDPESKWDGVKVRTTDFPQKMKIARTRTGLSQKKVADVLKIHQSYLAKYELGQMQPDFETLAKITIYYRVRADWLLGLTDTPDFLPAGTDGTETEVAKSGGENEPKKEKLSRSAS